MKKLLFALLALTFCMVANAKVIKITMSGGYTKVYASSQLESINFNDDGTITVMGYDYKVLETLDPELVEIEIDDEEETYEYRNQTVEFSLELANLGDGPLFTRTVRRINFVYPSTDPFGDPITLSGTILIPFNIWRKEAKSEGILLFNHFTVFNKDEAPSRGYAYLEGMFLANPLNPNYIVVESDYYGFGVTERFPQAYIQGTVNARANLDCLLAARRLLKDIGVKAGPLTFNLGYSSGGFEALATQKLRDMEYADQISFDKTFAGGSPSDIRECYRQYVEINHTAYNAVPPLLMVSTNEIQQLGKTYEEIFVPEVADNVDKYINSKMYTSWEVCDMIGREKNVDEILTAEYCNLESSNSKEIQDVLHNISITNDDDWTPDPSQKIYVMHSRDDDYVPVQSARPIIPYLQERGYEPSIIPGLTNLQTNFVIPKLGHLSATAIYLVQSLAAVAAWPLMYKNGEMISPYKELLQVATTDPVSILRYLDSQGMDCRALINEFAQRISSMMESGGGSISIDPAKLQTILQQISEKLGFTLSDLNEMLSDSGIDMMKLFSDFVEYMNEHPEEVIVEPEPAPVAPAMLRAAKVKQQTPAQEYEQQLYDWLSANGVKTK